VKHFGLMAEKPIHWLLSTELEVKRRIEEFAADQGKPVLEVVGPPSAEEIIARRINPKKALELPMIRLHLRKVKHHLTGEQGIEVKCSDAHMDLIVQWARQAEMRKALAREVVPAF
jgi:hypothetical protein